MKIAFFGAGNMGSAIVGAAIESGAVLSKDILVYDRYRPAAEKLEEKYQICVSQSAAAAAAVAEILFIAVKPNIVPALLEEIRTEAVKSGKYIVSIAAGVKVETYTGLLENTVKLVRTIPNMPAMVREGVTGIYFHNFTDAEQDQAAQAFILDMFSSFGRNVVVTREDLIDGMVAVTSSSPAYVCLMVEAMADAAVMAGFARKDAYIMAEQAVLGTAKLMLDRSIHPAVLKDQICSPAGTTIEAVASLEESGFRSSLIRAMEACRQKTLALGRKDNP